MSGFGLLINEQFDSKTNGIHVLERRGKSKSVAAKELAQIIIQHVNMSVEATQKAKTNARDISELYTWRNCYDYYFPDISAICGTRDSRIGG